MSCAIIPESMKLSLVVIAAILLVASETNAQHGAGPIEVGVQITGAHLHKIDQTPLGFGARVFFDVTKRFSLDAEIDRYTENLSGRSGETAALFGIKNGWRWDGFGVFAKARSGVMHFGPTHSDQRLERRTVVDVDLGGVLEYYPSPRIAVRIDLGDAILFYGGSALATVHNFQPALGFGFRF